MGTVSHHGSVIMEAVFGPSRAVHPAPYPSPSEAAEPPEAQQIEESGQIVQPQEDAEVGWVPGPRSFPDSIRT